MTSFPLHDRALAYVRHCVGVHEVPNGSNRGPLQVMHPNGGVDLFEDADNVAGHGYPYCISTIQKAWEVAGHPLPYRTAGAYELARWARQVGWARPLAECIPGDPIIFKVGSGHGALLDVPYEPRSGQVHTVDGNVQNRVMRVTRPSWKVHTAIHVPEKHRLPPPPEPYWVIATSANGHRVLLFSKYATEKIVLNKILPPLIAKYGKAGITIKRGGVRKK